MIKILLIDDEEELVTTLKERLAYREIDADYSLNGADAIQKVRHNEYDVLILDLKLPGIGGLETLRVIKAERPNLPIIMITGHGGSDVTDDFSREVFEFLPKPIAIDKLVQSIYEAMKSK
jgi:DNA-binding NtrC family response regulator